MKRTSILLSLLALGMHQSYGQFQRSYGTSYYETGRSLTKAVDNGYVFAGQTYSPFIGNGDATLTKTFVSGAPIWAKAFGGGEFDIFNSVRRNPYYTTSQVAYICAGSTSSFNYGTPGTQDGYVVGTDLNGNQLFAKVYGGKKTDKFFNAQAIVDPIDGPGFVFVGETNSFGLENSLPGVNVFVVRTDQFGNLKNSIVLGTKYDDRGYWIEQTSDKGYIVVGSTTAPLFPTSSSTDQNILAIKLDAQFGLQWERYLGGQAPLDDIAYCVKEYASANARGFLLTGISRSFGQGDDDAFLLNFDYSGNVTWMKTYGLTKSDRAFSLVIHKNSDGRDEVVVAGQTQSFGNASEGYLFKTDILGNLFWTKTYGGARDESFSEVILGHLPGPGYATVGTNVSFNGYGSDHYLSAFDNSGKTGTECDRIVQQPQVLRNPLITKGLTFVKVGDFATVPTTQKPVRYMQYACGSSFQAREEEEEGLIVREISEVTVAPNPVAGSSFTLSVPLAFEGATYQLIDLHGNLVKEGKQESVSSMVNAEDLTEGMYVIQLTNENGETKTAKFIKK